MCTLSIPQSFYIVLTSMSTHHLLFARFILLSLLAIMMDSGYLHVVNLLSMNLAFLVQLISSTGGTLMYISAIS